MKRFLINIIRFEKRFKIYILLLTILLVYTLLYFPLIEKPLVNTIAPYLKIKSSYWGDIVFGLIYLLSFIALCVKVAVSFWKRKPKIDDMIWPLFIIILYFIHRFCILQNSTWYFLNFKSIELLKYADGIVLLIVVFIYNPKKYLREGKKLEGIPVLYEDNLNQKNGGTDILKRGEYAKYISKLILNQKSKTSFAIGVRGSWGSGKSVFLKKIENEIHNAIKIRFNPWLSKTTDDVLGDFFNILIDRISDYDSGLSKRFRKYYSSLVNLDESFSKKMFSSLGIIKNDKESSLEEQQKQIINRLNTNKLKL
jgi:hypothetical protein